ncbi:G-protein coupled receptor Mth2 [Gryllus bimaculatus]|nr:G-protein coupled receptor Mth2 [Gryllus bimaculatus]
MKVCQKRCLLFRIQLTKLNLYSKLSTHCKNQNLYFAFIIYFAFLASFFWLNVMCLDIWWTFSGFRPMRGSVKEREHKKFIIYSLYCWGSPLIMLIICMVMDLHPDIPDSYIKPGFGELKCWFKSNLGNFIYFSGPIAILIICNIILFILTAVKIQQVKRGTKILKKQDSRRHNEEEENNAQRFNLYFKLFLVMGVNWIMEIVSFAAGGPDEYWYITDIANTLQDRIRKLLMERFCPGRAANTNSLNNSSSTRTTGIRHNGSVMSSHRPSFKNKDDYQMKTLTSPSARL